ncbi:hypothetical protein EON83_22620 [bacterium]|nr:MAG: hypothetical protein EON83_22620 [bacterium]
MLLLITGASCVGKSTVRRSIEAELAPQVESVELVSLVPIPAVPDVAWRQQTVEFAVQHALKLQEQGKHLLLAGDPVPPGELLAAPSAPLLNGIAVCLLDVRPEAQKARLAGRGEPENYWGQHLAFAEWMREHARNPQHLPIVVHQGAWEEMQWGRWKEWQAGDPRWRFDEIDTTELDREEVAAAALQWCRSALAGQAAILRGQWWE